MRCRLRRLRLAALLLLLGAGFGRAAAPDTAQQLDDAIALYARGKRVKARNLFLAVVLNGQKDERVVARSYLRKSDMQHLGRPTGAQAGARATKSARLTLPERPHFSGFLQNETAYRWDGGGWISKARTMALVNAEGRAGPILSYKVSGRALWDAAYDLHHHYSDRARDDGRWDADLRDTYVDASLSDWDIRVGKQTVVWGEAIGLFFADVVNARDLREFILPDFDYIRRPEWSFVTEYTQDEAHAEFLWIPFPVVDRYPVQGSEFFVGPPAPAGARLTVDQSSDPPRRWSSSEVGGRMSALYSGWDVSLFFLSTPDKSPSYFPVGVSEPFHLVTDSARVDIEGGTLAKELWGTVFRSEVVRTGRKRMREPSFTTVETDVWSLVFGAEHSFGDWDVGLQASHDELADPPPGTADWVHRRTNLAFSVRSGSISDVWSPSLTWIASIHDRDGLVRPRVTWTLTPSWRLITGFDVFYGKTESFFGRFGDRDRLYGELRYSF